MSRFVVATTRTSTGMDVRPPTLSCGGAVDGRCEVDPSLGCIWFDIEERLNRIGKPVDSNLFGFKDYSVSVYPRRLKLEEEA